MKIGIYKTIIAHEKNYFQRNITIKPKLGFYYKMSFIKFAGYS